MEITAEEKNILEQVYGKFVLDSNYGKNQIAEIQDLTAEERRFFERKNFVSPHFCVQTLYKIQNEISPIKFNRAVNSLVTEDENFRANFCNVGTRTVKVIFARREINPEINFRVLKLDAEELDETLIKIVEADRRLDFNIQQGNLIRFSAFSTGENESAVLITVSQLISKRFDSDSFFNAVFNNGNYKKIEPQADLKPPQIENRVKEYWTDLLKNLPAPPKLPFSMRVMPSRTQTNLDKLSSSEGVMLSPFLMIVLMFSSIVSRAFSKSLLLPMCAASLTSNSQIGTAENDIGILN